MNSKRMTLKAAVAAIAITGLGVFSSLSVAQASGPVRFVMPLAPGGGSDTIGRAVAIDMSNALNVTMVSENKPGASGTIALNDVVRSSPGNATIGLILGSTLGVVPHLMNVPYDSTNDLKPVAQLGITPFVLLVNKNHPAKTLAEFVELARTDSQSFGSFGAGTSSHVVGEAFNITADVKLMHVPYKGTAPAINDLLGGHVDSVIADFGAAGPRLGEGGQLRALAVTGADRSEGFPDVPTFSEQGYPDMNELVGWIGLVTPAHTSQEQIDTWGEAAANAVESTNIRKLLVDLGYTPTGTRGEEFGEIMTDEPVRWGALIEAANITLE